MRKAIPARRDVGGMRRTLSACAVAAGVSLLLTGFTGLDDAADPETPDGDIPIAGTFEHFNFGKPGDEVVKGAVLSARRTPGATVVYYAIGYDEAQGTDYRSSHSFPSRPGEYQGITGNVRMVNADEDELYFPLFSDEEKFASDAHDLESSAGDLRVGFVMFPEVSDEVETVDVIMPFRAKVAAVPVEDGLLEPIGDDAAPLLGDGWPEVPDESAIETADPEKVTYKMRQRYVDLEGTAEVEDDVDEVAVTLDANVLFEVDKADLSKKAQKRLDEVAEDITERGTGEVVITGHTDSNGGKDHNQKLSERRANSVLKAVKPAVDNSDVSFKTVGKGEEEPVESNSTDEGRAKNRRVTIEYQVVDN